MRYRRSEVSHFVALAALLLLVHQIACHWNPALEDGGGRSWHRKAVRAQGSCPKPYQPAGWAGPFIVKIK